MGFKDLWYKVKALKMKLVGSNTITTIALNMLCYKESDWMLNKWSLETMPAMLCCETILLKTIFCCNLYFAIMVLLWALLILPHTYSLELEFKKWKMANLETNWQTFWFCFVSKNTLNYNYYLHTCMIQRHSYGGAAVAAFTLLARIATRL